MPFSEKQIAQLLQAINPKRVLKDGKGNAHVAANDIIGHLIRIFGFGGFDIEVLSTDLIFETERTDKPGRYDVAYKAFARVTVKDDEGAPVAFYEDGSTGSAQNQTRADGHDLALKSAISLAIKRCAKDLGDQYGLGLYSKGSLNALVKATLVGSPDAVEDVQAEVEQVVSMGNDEIDTAPEPEVEAPAAKPAAKKAATNTNNATVTSKEAAIATLKTLCAKSEWPLDAINALYLTTYKVGVADGSADDLKAFTALLETGAIKVPA